MRALFGLPLAATISGLAHLGLAAGLAWALAPRPVPDQPPRESRLTVEAYQVERSTATEQQPTTEATAAEDAKGAALAAGAVPQSRARPAAPPEQRLTAASTDGQPAAAAPARGDAVTLAETAAEPLAPAIAPAETLASAAPQVQAAPAASMPTQTLTARLTPTVPLPADVVVAPTVAVATPQAVAVTLAVARTAPLPETIPVALTAPTATPPAQPLAAAAPTSEPATPTEAQADIAASLAPKGADLAAIAPPAEKGKATLAFAGPEGTLDPKSLAAIQAFMQPGDAASAASEVRDGIAGLLASVPCARLQVEYDPDAGALTLRGHIPEDGLRAPVLAALAAEIGPGIPVKQDLRLLPRPQCGALAGIGEVGLPQSSELYGNPRIIGADGYVAEEHYTAGQYVHFSMEGLDYPAYVYVDYFFADGTVAHLVPNDTVPLSLLAPKARFTVGSETPGPGELALQVGPPYGQEIAVAFAASVPLYEGLRPLSEPAETYLAFLKERVAATRAATPDFKGEWVYFFISTSAG